MCDLFLIEHVVYQKQQTLKLLVTNTNNVYKWKRTKKLFIQFFPLTIVFCLTELPYGIRQALRSIFPGFVNGICEDLENYCSSLQFC